MTDEAGEELSRLASIVTPMAIRVAATLRLADHIAEGRRTAEDLAAAANADMVALERLLRHLVTVGVLTRDGAGDYGLTALGEALRERQPDRLRSHWDLEGAIGRADMAFAHLLHSVRTGEAAYPLQFGRSFWEDLEADRRLAASFDAQMGADASEWAAPVVTAFDWGRLGWVVDVGGGNGTVLLALLKAFPRLRGTVVDLQGAAETARRSLRHAGLSVRGEAVAGSFFEPLPPGAGGYILTAIIHNWPDAEARTILRRCAEAAGREGAVFVVEAIGGDGRAPNTFMDLRMLAYFGGQERSVEEIARLAEGAGLRPERVHPAGRLAVIELRSI